jgi:hypothetical protein
MKYNAVDVIKPKLYKDVFPYEEIPKIKFNNIQLPIFRTIYGLPIQHSGTDNNQ